MFNHGFYARLRAEAGPHWHNYTHHQFVSQLAAGTLPDVAFRHYLMQDYRFLIHFARAHGLLVSKLTQLPDMQAANAILNAILSEMPLHVSYCQGWGLDESMMADAEEAPATVNYTRYVLDIGHAGDCLDLMVALAPCIAGYAEIGLRLLSDPATRINGNPYAAWIQNYGDPAYLQGVNAALNLLERLSEQHAGPARLAALSNIFTTATRLESAFWQMGLNATAEVNPVR